MWPRSKWFRGSLFVTVPILLVISYCLLFRWSEKWGEAKFNKIKTGISRMEVEAVLGGPPDSYTTKPFLGGEPPPGRKEAGGMGTAILLPLHSVPRPNDPEKHWLYVWNFDDGTAWVECYDEKVAGKSWYR